MKRILALDLDGTAVGDDGQISQANVKALKDMRDAGHAIAIVTGRRRIENAPIDDICHDLADYILFNMGGTLVRTADSATIFDTFIDEASASALLEHCLEQNLQLSAFGPGFWKVNKWTEGLTQYTTKIGVSPETYKSLTDVPYTQIEGMMATLDARPITRFLDSRDFHLDYVDSEPDCVDILPRDLHKWSGISRLLEMINGTPEQVIAIGDYDSDVSMLRAAGTGVAVANARPAAKNAANFVTVNDNNHNAVADAVNQLVFGVGENLLMPAGNQTAV